MLENITCGYCEHWKHAKIRRRKQVEENGKKKGKKIKNEKVIKICSIGPKKHKINLDSFACRYFNPSHLFYCNENNCFLDLVNCIQRRRNPKNFKAWENCKKCRQWYQGIEDIMKDYYIGNTPILTPKGRKIKRRATVNPGKRKIKRRSIKPKRIIKRRKPKRIIKRRKK